MSIEGNTPEKNEILMTWFNRYAGVTIKTPSKTLVIDPVEVKPRNLKNIDVVLITHEHYDHLDQLCLSEIHKLTKCEVVADSTSARKLQTSIPPEKLREISPGSEIKFEEVSIKAEKCNHPPANTPVTFIITSEDGVKVYHTADSLPFPEMAEIGEREKLDVAFCAVGIAPGVSPKTGVEIVKLIKPQVAIPYHTPSTSEQKKFSELLKKDMPNVTCLIPEVGKIYQVFKRSKENDSKERK